MKRALVNAISVFFCFILQTSIFERIKLAGVKPNILIILVASIAVMRGQKEGMLAGFFSGLLLDIFYSSYLGIFAMVYMLIGFVAGYFHRIYYEEDNVLPLMMIGAADFVFGLIMFMKEGLLHNHRNIFFYLRKTILPEVVYTVLLAFLIYWILLRLNRWITRREDLNADII